MKTVSYGALIGLGLAVIIILLDWLLPPGTISGAVAETVGYVTIVAFCALVIFVLRARRRDAPKWGFGIALRDAVITVAMIALVTGACLFAYYSIQPETLLRMYEYYQQTLQAAAGDSDSAAQLADMEKNRDLYLDPGFQAGVMTATVLAVGLIVGAFCAYFTRRP